MLERFKVPEADRVYVREAPMRAATEAIFVALGLPEDDARQSADVLMFNDLRGIETHGVSNMLRSYVAGYRAGTLTPRPEIIVERETPTTALIDGGGGLGLHVAPHAMGIVIAKAREYGMGSAVVHHVGHMGGAGYHAMLALDHDMIGVAMSTSGRAIVVPTWGAEPRLGTNPIAWAVPAGEMAPFVFDIGTSQVAANKMRLAQRVGAKIAPGWIARMDGTPVMEEVDVPDEFYLLPAGGTRELGSHKGYGLGAVVDILGSTLAGIGPGFVANTPGYHLAAYRVDAFIDVAQFKRDMDTFLRGLAETKPAPGHERVVYAGLLEAEEEVRRRADGIPYHTEVIDWFRGIEGELGLDFAFT
ncbi:MAG: Ldh family oxidoreductase [Chloroflexi bacterium]|nr:Ldh family oxidoreductase [Chloroflexota bacterium]MDA1001972.1 Ldh family oxidoreductase [Chloroflexota bacterium]